MGEGETGVASDIVKSESSGEDPRATGGLLSNPPHPRVNKKKQHSLCCDLWVWAPIGLVKGLILGSPNACAVTFAVTLILAIFFPWNFLLAARVVWTTAYLGPNVRSVLLLFLPIISVVALTATPIVVFLCAFFYSVFAVGATVTSSDDDCTTMHMFKQTWKGGVHVIYKHQIRAGEAALDLCDVPRGWQGDVFEIPLTKAFVGAVIIIIGTFFGVLLIPALMIVKTPTGYFWANKYYISEGFDLLKDKPVFFLLVVLGFCLMNVLALPAIFLIGAPLYSLTIGIQSAAAALQFDIFSEGFRQIFRLIREFDQFTTAHLVLGEDHDISNTPSCIPRMKEQVSRVHDNAAGGDTIQDSFHAIFESYVRQAATDTAAAVDSAWITAAHVHDLEPYLMVGIPALAIFSVLVRSAASAHGRRELVCESTDPTSGIAPASGVTSSCVVTEESKPNHGETNRRAGGALLSVCVSCSYVTCVFATSYMCWLHLVCLVLHI